MEKEISYLTSLIGDPVRTHILWSLLDGRAYTATELAVGAETSAPNISMHLGKLVDADLLSVESQGRHKYYKIAKPEVAYTIESIASLIPPERQKTVAAQPDDTPIRFCRTCYDHLAGTTGVLITTAFLKSGLIRPGDGGYVVTGKGKKEFAALGIDTEELKRVRRTFAKPCLDWSERKHHLAGALGAAILDAFFSRDYLRRVKNSRAVIVTAKGKSELYNQFRVVL